MVYLPTVREGNVFTGVCHSVHNRPHAYSVTAHPCWLLGHLSWCGRYASYWNAFLFTFDSLAAQLNYSCNEFFYEMPSTVFLALRSLGLLFLHNKNYLDAAGRGSNPFFNVKNKNLLFKGNSIPSNYRRTVVLSNNKGYITSNSFRNLTQRRRSGGIRILRGNMSNDKSNN